MSCLLCRSEKEGVSPNYKKKKKTTKNCLIPKKKRKKMHKEKGEKKNSIIPRLHELAMHGLLLSGGRGCPFGGDLNS